MGRGGAPARRGRAAKGAKSQLGKDNVKSTEVAKPAQEAKATKGKKAPKNSLTAVPQGGKAPISKTPTTLSIRTVPARARRKPSRYSTEVTLEERDRHQNEETAVADGMNLLELFRSSLRLISEETSESGKIDAAMRGKEKMQKALAGHKVTERDWASFDVVSSMSEALDLDTEPSLEYTLGVLGVTELPESLEERSRALGAKKYNEMYRSSLARRRKEERERKTEKAEKAKVERERRENQNKEKEKPKKKSDVLDEMNHDNMDVDTERKGPDSKEIQRSNEDMVQSVKNVTIDEAQGKESSEKVDQAMLDSEGSTDKKLKVLGQEETVKEKKVGEESKGMATQKEVEVAKNSDRDHDANTKHILSADEAVSSEKTSESFSTKRSDPHSIVQANKASAASGGNEGADVKTQSQVRRSSRLKASEPLIEQEHTEGATEAKNPNKQRPMKPKDMIESHTTSKGAKPSQETDADLPKPENSTEEAEKTTSYTAKSEEEDQTTNINEDDASKSEESSKPFTRLPKRKGRSRFGAKAPRANPAKEQSISAHPGVGIKAVTEKVKDDHKNQGHDSKDAVDKSVTPSAEPTKQPMNAKAIGKMSDGETALGEEAGAIENRDGDTRKTAGELSDEKKLTNKKDLEKCNTENETGEAPKRGREKALPSLGSRLLATSENSRVPDKVRYEKEPSQGINTNEQDGAPEKDNKIKSKAEADQVKLSSAVQKEKQVETQDSGEKSAIKANDSHGNREKKVNKSKSEIHHDRAIRNQSRDASQEKAATNEKSEAPKNQQNSPSKNTSKQAKENIVKQENRSEKKRPLTTKELEKEAMAAVFGDSDSDEEMELDRANVDEHAGDDRNERRDLGISKDMDSKQEKSVKDMIDEDGEGDISTRHIKSKGKGRGRRRVHQKEGPQAVISKSERRVSSRRHSTREDIVIPHSKHTRLRRESTNLTDGRLVLDTNDEHMLQCAVVWQKVQTEKISIPFREPVQKKDAPDYFDIVKKPMDLATVRKNMEGGVIKSPVDFYDQMIQIVKNAFIYNPKDSDLWELATELEELIRDATRPIVIDWCKVHGESCDFSDSDKEAEEAGEEDIHHAEPETAEVQKRKKRIGRPPKPRKEIEVEPITSSKRGRGRGRGRARGRRGGGITRTAVNRKRAAEFESDSAKPKKRRVGRPRKDGS